MLKILFILISLNFVSFSTAGTWVSNRDHSEVLFQVPYMGVSELTGRFNEFHAEAIFEENKSTITNIIVQINTASIDTGNKMRDGHLKGSDFFQSTEYPHIVFTSQKISSSGKGQYKASGELIIKGIKKPSTIEFSVTDSLKDTWGYDNKFVKFKSRMSRKDYNINWNKTLEGQKFLVGDDITFWGTFQIQPSKNLTPNSKHMIPDTQHIRKREEEKRTEESSFSQKFRKLINGK